MMAQVGHSTLTRGLVNTPPHEDSEPRHRGYPVLGHGPGDPLLLRAERKLQSHAEGTELR